MSNKDREAVREQKQEEQAATTPLDFSKFKGAKKHWCLFRTKRRCYVEGILVEEPGWEIALSPEAAIRVKGNKHLQLIAGAWPETEMVDVLDEYGDPTIRGGNKLQREVLKDKDLLDLDGDPVIRKVSSQDDEQSQLRQLASKPGMGAGHRPEHMHPGFAPRAA